MWVQGTRVTIVTSIVIVMMRVTMFCDMVVSVAAKLAAQQADNQGKGANPQHDPP